MKSTDIVDQPNLRTDIPNFGPGDEVKVHVKVVEGNKERVQVFQGNVIARQGSGVAETYTVRKISYGVGVERTFPVHTPTVAKLETTSRRLRRTSAWPSLWPSVCFQRMPKSSLWMQMPLAMVRALPSALQATPSM